MSFDARTERATGSTSAVRRPLSSPTPRHGAPSPVPVEALLSDDPKLALVTADMDVWAAAHPCEGMARP